MSSMREPIHPGHVPNKPRAESRFVKRFWEKHYNFKCDKVFNHPTLKTCHIIEKKIVPEIGPCNLI